MRKKYVAPVIAVEHYELTQTIAACNIAIGAMNNVCVLKDADSTTEMKALAANNWFIAEGGCMKYEVTGSSEDGICYHTSVNAAFQS